MPRTETIYEDDELGLQPGWDEHLDPNIRRELRQSRIVARERDAERTAREAAERELTLYRAGIPGDARGQAFAKVYDGDSTNPDAIKAAYEELFGPVQAGSGAPAGAASTAADQRIADAAGAGAGTAGTPGTVDLAEAIRGAKTTAEVLEIVKNAPPEAGLRLPED